MKLYTRNLCLSNPGTFIQIFKEWTEKRLKDTLDNITKLFETDNAKKRIRAQIAMVKGQAAGGEAGIHIQ